MQPAIRPGESQSVLRINRCSRESPPQPFIHGFETRAPRHFRFYDRVAWGACHQRTHRHALAREQRQHQRETDRRIATDMQRRIHHATIPFAADDRFQRDHRARDVRFAYGCAHDLRPELSGCIFDDETGREIADDGLTARRPDGPNRKGERVVFSDRSTVLVDDR